MAAAGHMAMNHRPVSKILLFAGSTATTAPVYVYEWLPDVGFGTKLANGPNTTAISGYDTMTTNSAGDRLGVASGNSPRVHVFAISRDGVGTKFSDPATLPTGLGRNVNFSPSGDAVILGHGTSPYISAYPLTAGGFGTKYANPATLPTTTGAGAAWTPAGTELAVVQGNVPRFSAYYWSSSTGFGTRQTNSYSELSIAPYSGTWSSDGSKFISGGSQSGNYGPLVASHTYGAGFSSLSLAASQIPGTVYATRINKAETAIVLGHSTTPFMSAYQWSNSAGVGTRYANPTSLVTNYSTAMCFSPSGTDVVGAITVSTIGVAAYKWTDAGGFGTKYNDPATGTGANTRGAALQPFYQ